MISLYKNSKNRPRIKKIIFFLEAYFNQRDYERFGIDILKDNGFEVEVWEFTEFITSEEYRQIKPPDPIDCENRISFRSETEVISKILTLTPSCFVVSFIHCNQRTMGLHKALTKKRIPYCIHGFALPTSITKKEIILNRFRNFAFKKLIKKINDLNYLSFRPADIILATGEKYSTGGFLVNKKSEILWVHSFDYDTYLKANKFPAYVDSRVGVFLDEYFPFHSDFANADLNSTVTPEEYYPLLCNFFGYLEKKFAVRIIIAAHPRSHYDRHGDCFGKREVIRGKTAELVRSNGFALMHHSTAINFAVLFKKPIIFMTTDKLDSFLLEDPSVEWLANFFGKKAHNLSRNIDIDFEAEMSINEKAYHDYRNAYIKKDGSEELPCWQILANRIKTLNG